MGLKSFCIDVGGLTFGASRPMTSADFQMHGTQPSHMEAFNISATGSLISGANSFGSQFRSPSGPGDLCILRYDRWYSTYVGLIMNSYV